MLFIINASSQLQTVLNVVSLTGLNLADHVALVALFHWISVLLWDLPEVSYDQP